MKRYCITWGETGIQSFVFAKSESEAVAKFTSDIRKTWGKNFEPNIKYIDVIK